MSCVRSVLLALLAGCTLLGGAALAAAEQPVPLRIVAFNCEVLKAPGVRQGEFDRFRYDTARAAHHERVAAVIEALCPDIVALEEVISRESIDLLVEILHQKGLTDYRGYHVENHDSYSGMDVAMLCRVPPDRVEGAELRTIYSEEDDPTWREAFTAPGIDGKPLRRSASLSRSAVYYFTVAGHKLGFLGLHLKANPQDAYSNALRKAEVRIAQRVLQGEIVRRGYLPIVLGDLNDFDPVIEDVDPVRGDSTGVLKDLMDFDPKRPGPELVSAAEWIPRLADRFTNHWDVNENGAADPGDVFTMLDHILLAEKLRPKVRRAFICHSVPEDTSDHRPVVVDLMLPPIASPMPR